MRSPRYLPCFYSQLDEKEKPELHWFMKMMQFYLKVPAVKFIISTVCITYLVYLTFFHSLKS